MFDETLTITLRLGIAGKEHLVPGGWVKRCALDLEVHGFRGSIGFWRDKEDDGLLEPMLGTDLIELHLTIVPGHRERQFVPIELHAVVTERAVVEMEVVQLEGEPVMIREYTLRFVDMATLLWRQHRPLALRADATVKDMIIAEAANGMQVDVELDDAARKRPLVCIPTGDGAASFYDFVLWYADAAGGCFAYDYYARSPRYVLAAARPTAKSDKLLERLDAPNPMLIAPAPGRHTPRLLNAHGEAKTALTKVEQQPAVEGIVRDRLIRTPKDVDVDAEKETEGKRWHAPLPELELELSRYPAIALMPGAEAAVDEKQHSSKLYPTGKQFRVLALAFAAEAAQGPSERNDGDSRLYQTELSMRWESADDARARLPAFTAPTWPLYVEGKIVANGGEPGDRFVMPLEDKEEGLSYYEVFVPAWNQKIRVPFGPGFLPGHFFAPAFQGSRVLLALHFDRAEIAQFLDWGPDVRLPADSQGNHLLFGKNQSSQTSLKHAYVDGKPVLSIDRAAGADRGRLQLDDGNLVLEVKEDTTAQTAQETHSLVLEQEMAKGQVQGKSEEAVGETRAKAQASSRALDGKLDDMQANLQASIDGVKGTLGGHVDAAKGELAAQTAQIDDQVSALQGRAQEAIAAIRAQGATQ